MIFFHDYGRREIAKRNHAQIERERERERGGRERLNSSILHLPAFLARRLISRSACRRSGEKLTQEVTQTSETRISRRKCRHK